ncbi:hypothetical protein ACFL0S_12500, partial [Thermodesulfobacteriota bacterium]
MTSIGPVTAAPTIGWDSQNFWVYYGTGRFFATEDKTDETTQHFFGVKEPFDNTCELTFKEITWPQTPNPSRAETTDSVERGLART